MSIEAFLPTTKTTRQWSDRKKKISKPLFPSYVFVNIKSNLELHNTLLVEGNCGFIRFGSEYAIVTESEINKIKLLTSIENITNIEVTHILPKKGDIKKISYGALTGLECEVLEVSNSKKIIVQINSLKQAITATVPLHYFQEELNLIHQLGFKSH